MHCFLLVCEPWSSENGDGDIIVYYKFGFLCSSNGGKQQSDGAGVVVGAGGSGRPVPALVLWMATRWKEKCGRAGGNHQGECSFYVDKAKGKVESL